MGAERAMQIYLKLVKQFIDKSGNIWDMCSTGVSQLKSFPAICLWLIFMEMEHTRKSVPKCSIVFHWGTVTRALGHSDTVNDYNLVIRSRPFM